MTSVSIEDGINSVTQKGAAPSEPAPKSGEQKQVAARIQPGLARFIHGERHGCRSGVSSRLDVVKHLLRRQAKAATHRFIDSEIRLVRDDEFDAAELFARLCKSSPCRCRRFRDRTQKNFHAVHHGDLPPGDNVFRRNPRTALIIEQLQLEVICA